MNKKRGGDGMSVHNQYHHQNTWAYWALNKYAQLEIDRKNSENDEYKPAAQRWKQFDMDADVLMLTIDTPATFALANAKPLHKMQACCTRECASIHFLVGTAHDTDRRSAHT
jgi:hypothetical protein